MLAGFGTARPEVPQARGALDAPLLPCKVALVVRAFFEVHGYDGRTVVIIARRCILNESVSEIGRRSEVYIGIKALGRAMSERAQLCTSFEP